METKLPAPGGAAVDGTVLDGAALVARIRQWGRELGFDAVGVGGVDLTDAEPGLAAWLEAGFHGHMDYMARHGMKRARAAELLPGSVRVISGEGQGTEFCIDLPGAEAPPDSLPPEA